MEVVVHTAKEMNFPAPIPALRIKELIDKGVHSDIANLDFEMIKMKLQEKDEGLGWTKEQCKSGELEYKRYLTLCHKYGKGMVPNKIMDNFWHFHILDTRLYVKNCEDIFSGYMHHYPYFGMRGEQDAEDLKQSFYQTKKQYEKLFGEPIARSEHSDCWHDCENRCWHACPSIGIQ